jgi:hypothetical protein
VSEELDQQQPPQSVTAVAKRAQEVGWEVEWRTHDDLSAPALVIYLPNGREKRRLVVNEGRAIKLLNIELGQYRLLGDYLAIDNYEESYFEAAVRPSAPGTSLMSLPGVEVISTASKPETADSGDEAFDDGSGTHDSGPTILADDKWKLEIDDERSPRKIEFSEASDAFYAMVNDLLVRPPMRGRRGSISLKIWGLRAVRHESAVRMLEEFSGSLLFELDVRYGAAYQLGHFRNRSPMRSRQPSRVQQPPSMPRFRYPSEALSLYNYGRSATGMPLLQFLAFYQVLEFFFPQHFRQHLLKRLRLEIIDPRFEVGNDTHLAKLLNLASSGGRGNGSEREQLRATVNACVDETTLREFLRDDTERLDDLGDKKRIHGVPIVTAASRNSSLLDQVVERVYALRCRIVHAKADGGDSLVELLLPGGSEASALGTDVDLVQFLAQKAIIAGGSALG